MIPTRDSFYDTLALINVRIGAEVRRLREARGMSASALAEAIGVSNSFVSAAEAGRLRFSRLESVADALGVEVSHFEHVAHVCPSCSGRGVMLKDAATARRGDAAGGDS